MVLAKNLLFLFVWFSLINLIMKQGWPKQTILNKTLFRDLLCKQLWETFYLNCLHFVPLILSSFLHFFLSLHIFIHLYACALVCNFFFLKLFESKLERSYPLPPKYFSAQPKRNVISLPVYIAVSKSVSIT